MRSSEPLATSPAPTIGSGAARADLARLLLADARLPVGGHAQSGGLEPGLLSGLDATDLPAYLTARLATVARTDAATAVVARAAALAAGRGAPTFSADEVATAWAARTPSEVVRAAARQPGRGIHRLLARLLADGPEEAAAATAGPGRAVVAWLEELPRERRYRPVALGALAAHLGLGSRATAQVSAYDDVQTVAYAAPKLLPLDPLDPVGWTLGAAPELAELADAVAGVTHPDDIPSVAAPHLDAWHARHARSTRRLFHA